VTGRRVATLRNGPTAAGRHAVTWNGRDDAGKLLAAGIYFGRVETPEREQCVKITRIR
ncbi:MAG: hypothetical protein KC591_13470, partial [Gemmatimonadetes bacterium]|nr:hypothetical protein [Gemmatimonadota bacterium]